MRPVGLVLALAVALLLGGCTTIPDAGSVQAGPTSVPDDPALVFQPYPPPPGADPADIVSGFVQAASAGRDYRVAKEFLTPAFAGRWAPNDRVLVHNQAVTARSVGQNRVELAVPTIARVDGAGVYTPTTRNSVLRYSLLKVSGQWRIDDGPDGVVLDQEVFAHNFQQATLQYFDPTFTRLVPDLRWFPFPLSTSRVVRALIGGRAPPLAAPVSASAFPDGTAVRSLSTSAGVLTLSIRVSGAAPSATATTRMQQQLVRSLPPSITALRLVVDGRSMPTAAPLHPVPSDTRPAVLAGGRFGVLNAQGALVENRELGKSIAAAHPSAITVSARQRFAAVLSPAGASVVQAGRATRVIDPRVGLLAPTADQSGWIYTVPAGDPEGLIAHSLNGQGVTLPVTLGGSEVLALEASPDGTRMLVVLRTQAGSQAYVAGIERSANGTPIGLSAARYLFAAGPDPITDGTWVDDGSVSLLTAGPQGQEVAKQPLGGLSSSLGRLSSAVSTMVGGTEQGGPRVLTEDTGDLYVSAGDNQWQPEFDLPVKVSVLAVQR